MLIYIQNMGLLEELQQKRAEALSLQIQHVHHL